ncbi:MAG: SMEK domain-containing protein, partial [Clostridiales bacterium]|nr:SMEK domain-containing protein [Candidatus Blautia equi]
MSILNREKYFESIRRWLYSIKVEVEGSNKDRHYDINTEMEDLVAGLLNLVYDWKLHNANHDKKNMAGIDLWEDKTGLSRDLVAVQVTSTFERKKVQDTLDKFFRLRDSGELDQRYRKLVVFMLVTKKEYNKSFDTKGEIELQILTFEDLIGELRKRTEKGRLKDLRFLRKVDKYLEINIDREKNRKYWKIICLIAGLGILGSGGSYYLASHNSQTDQKNISTETMPAETESETKLEEPEKETTPPETGTTEPQSETKQVETEKETTPPEKGTTEPQSETKLEEPEKETIPPETRAVEPQSETKLEEPEKETAPQETVATETQPETEWVETEKETPEPETFVVEPESDIPEYIAEPKAQTLVSESQSHNHLVKKSDIHGYQFYIEKPGIFDVDLTCEEKGSNTSRFIITLYDLDHEQEIACTEIPGNIETG